MKHLLSVLMSFLMVMVCSINILCQSHPTLSTPLKQGGIYSRNMELLDVIPIMPTSGDQFMIVEVEYHLSGGGTGKKVVLVSSAYVGQNSYSSILIYDVTNPRAIDPNISTQPLTEPYLYVSIKGGEDDPEFGNIGISQSYRIPGSPSTENFNGDVFLIAWVGDEYRGKQGGLWLEEDEDPAPEEVGDSEAESNNNEKARFIIVNLTKAIELRESGTASEIVIHDPKIRNVTYNGTSQNNANIYLGYVASDYKWFKKLPYSWITEEYAPEAFDRSIQEDPHALNADQQAGFMTLSPHRRSNIRANSNDPDDVTQHPFVECFDLSTLSSNYTPSTNTDPAAGVFSPVRTSTTYGNVSDYFPVRLPTFGSSPTLYPLPKDIEICSTGTKQVRLVIGSTSGSKHDGQIVNHHQAGGVVSCVLDYSASSVSVSNSAYWPYDCDRVDPDRRYTQQSGFDWTSRICHTALPIKLVGESDTYVITADEFAGTSANPIRAYYSDTRPGESSPYYEIRELVTNGSRYVGGLDPTFLDRQYPLQMYPTNINDSKEDDRRYGSYIRVWNAEISGGTLNLKSRGIDDEDDGPIAIYVSPESEDNDDLYYESVLQLPSPNTDISVPATAAFGPTSTNKLGLNTVHRPHIIREYDYRYSENANDVFVSSYVSGTRVVNLTNVSDGAGLVNEKAFFDFIPRLSYDAYDPYFYKLSPQSQSGYANWNAFGAGSTIGNYFLGVWHSIPDFGSSRVGTNGTGTLPADEKFIYAMAFGEGKFNQNVIDGTTTIIAQDPSAVDNARNWLLGGGFLVLRYFDQKLGGTISGYSGSSSWSDKSFRTINLQGDFDVQRDVTIAAGACVQLIPGHSNDPGIFQSTSLSTSSNRTLFVDGTLNISVPEGDPEGTDVVIDVPIVVRTGGKLNVYKINSNAKVVFKKTVTVNSNGSWMMYPAANVELDEKTHYCNGRFTIEGTSTDPVVFTGRRANGQSSARGSFVQGRGTGARAFPWRLPMNPALTGFQIKYGYCKDAYFDMFRMESSCNVKELEHSRFERTVGFDDKYALVHVENPLSYDPGSICSTYPPSYMHNFDVDDCLFIDNQNIDPVNNYQYRNIGLSVWSASNVNITNSTFDSFLSGAVLNNNRNFLCQASTFIDCNHGLNVLGTTGIECSSDFAGNEFSSVVSATPHVDYYDNTYDGCRVGIGIYTGGDHWLRGNVFEVYAAGLQNHAATTYLRDRVLNNVEDEYEFGRNDFLSPDDEFTVWNGQLMVTDINIGRGAQLFVDCGYNDFTDESEFHVYSDGGQFTQAVFDASNNRWAFDVANNIYQPRVNYPQINYNGWPYNVQEDSDEECGLIEVESDCQPIVCGLTDVNYPSLTEATSGLYDRISSLQSDVFNTGIPIACRRNLVWEYFQAVAHTDSLQLYSQLKADLSTIAANSSLSNAFRSQALTIKAKTHRLLEELDSARTVFNQVLSSYPNEADSIPSNWNLKLLDAMQDSTGHFDSLYKVYNERVLLDLRRPQGSGGFSKSTVNASQRASSNRDWLSISSVAPNPSSSRCEVSISTSMGTQATVDVVSVTGAILVTMPIVLERGSNKVQIDLPKASAGIYIVRCSARDIMVRLPIVVEP